MHEVNRRLQGGIIYLPDSEPNMILLQEGDGGGAILDPHAAEGKRLRVGNRDIYIDILRESLEAIAEEQAKKRAAFKDFGRTVYTNMDFSADEFALLPGIAVFPKELRKVIRDSEYNVRTHETEQSCSYHHDQQPSNIINVHPDVDIKSFDLLGQNHKK